MELGTALIDADRERYAKLIIKLGLWVVRKWVSSAKSRANGLKIVGLIVLLHQFSVAAFLNFDKMKLKRERRKGVFNRYI